jgi:bifunctional DNA-binding transcriptional regulator/antitoxin component of YhaV-PrlF toxin-antitoxin module
MLLYFSIKCKAMAEVRISSKNQIVIPREIREKLGVKGR